MLKLSLSSFGVALARDVHRPLVWAAKCWDCTLITSLGIKTFWWLAEPFALVVVWKDLRVEATLFVPYLCAVLVSAFLFFFFSCRRVRVYNSMATDVVKRNTPLSCPITEHSF